MSKIISAQRLWAKLKSKRDDHTIPLQSPSIQQDYVSTFGFPFRIIAPVLTLIKFQFNTTTSRFGKNMLGLSLGLG